MKDELPPLQGKFDDFCPLEPLLDVPALADEGEEDELESVAVLGYN